MKEGIRCLTYNVGMPQVSLLGKAVEPVPCVEVRFAGLADLLFSTRADVIFLQELFHAKHRHALVHHLASVYPYTYAHDDAGLMRMSNGLLCLSRFPIVRKTFVSYDECALEERMFVSKGFQSMDIQAPGVMISVVHTHLTAGGFFRHPEERRYDCIRAKQILQFQSHMNRFGCGLAIGDFNAGPQASPDNYDSLTGVLADAYVHADMRVGPEVTWDPCNPLNIGGPHKTSPPQRIDHILYNMAFGNLLKPRAVYTIGQTPFVQTDRGLVPISDHWGVLVEFIPVLFFLYPFGCIPFWILLDGFYFFVEDCTKEINWFRFDVSFTKGKS